MDVLHLAYWFPLRWLLLGQLALVDGHLVFPAVLAVCGVNRGVNDGVPFPTASIVFPARSQGLYQGFARDYQLEPTALDNGSVIVAIVPGRRQPSWLHSDGRQIRGKCDGLRARWLRPLGREIQRLDVPRSLP